MMISECGKHWWDGQWAYVQCVRGDRRVDLSIGRKVRDRDSIATGHGNGTVQKVLPILSRYMYFYGFVG